MHAFYVAQKITLLILTYMCVQGYGRPKSGPYKMFIDKVAVCKTLSHPAIKNPSVTIDVEVYNTTLKHFLIRGNFTVIRDTRNVVLRSKTFTWENGKWKIIYLISNMPCHGIFLPAAMKFMGIQFNEKECLFPKSFNHFKNINLNDLGHMVNRVAEYGRVMYRAEMLGKAMQTIYCWEFEGQVVPDM